MKSDREEDEVLARGFFDCNCMIGRWETFQPKSFYSIEGLLEEMNDYVIEEALVFHSLAKNYSPSIGNEKLLEELVLAEGKRRFHGCWVLLPPGTDEMPLPEKLIGEMLGRGLGNMPAIFWGLVL